MWSFLRAMGFSCAADRELEEVGKKQTKHTSVYLFILLLAFFDFWLIILLFFRELNNAALYLQYWFEWIAAGGSLILLLRNGMPRIGNAILAACLALLFCLADGAAMQEWATAAKVFLCSLAILRIFEKYPRRALRLIRAGSRTSFLVSLATGVCAGLLLGLVFLFLSDGTLWPDLHFSQGAVRQALRVLLRIEVCQRLLFAAVGLEILGGLICTKIQSIEYLLVIATPCTLLWSMTFFVLQEESLASAMKSGLLLIPVMGLPISVLYRDKGIVPALLALGLAAVMYFSS